MNDVDRLIAQTGNRFTQRIVLLGLGLTLLFTVTSPELTRSLSWAARLCFWTLHIGIGLGAAAFAAHTLVRHTTIKRDWRLIVLAGLGGVALFAPIALALEHLFPLLEQGPDDDWTDRLASKSLLAAVLVEAMELSPAYLSAWLLINIESFGTVKQWRGANALGRLEQLEGLVAKTPTPGSELSETPQAELHNEVANAPASGATDDPEASAKNELLSRLPPAIGEQLVCVSSDLHYLDVSTRQGNASILGSLTDIENVLGSRGLRVHRSHWVNLDEVMRVRKTSSGWSLDMSNGHSIPVSRRKKRLVSEQLGEGFSRVSLAS